MINNTYPDAGRVEILHDGEWGTVCDDNWDDRDAEVACRELGYITGEVLHYTWYNEGSGRIWLDEVQCAGNETSLANCPHKAWGDHNCIHAEDAGILCSKWHFSKPRLD